MESPVVDFSHIIPTGDVKRGSSFEKESCGAICSDVQEGTMLSVQERHNGWRNFRF
jgi:hypothetical protein